MKRYGYLWEPMCSLENIELAHHRARRGKRHYAEVKMVDEDPQRYFAEIRQMLTEKTFVNSDYTVMIKTEGPKEREIWRLPYYPDRIIHHCILNVLEPIFMRHYIRDTFAALPGRGIHDGVRRVRKALKDEGGTRYCLKLDVRKFYQSIDHNVLKGQIRKRVKDPHVLWLTDAIIDSAPGVPIGNYTSQHFANYALSDFDHWVKETLGVKHYFRYCDDMVLLSSDKGVLHAWRKEIGAYLRERMHLKVKDNWQVFPVADRGIDFLGYRFFHTHTLVRRSIVRAFKRRFRHGSRRSMAAYNGWFKWADTHNLKQKYDWRTA